MGAGLTRFDHEAIRILRDARVLTDYEARGRNGQIIVACSDGDQMRDLIHHTWREAIRSGRIFRPHLVTSHGGAMNLDHECDLFDHLSDIQLEHVRQAEDPGLKGITSVNLCIHAPCGAAAMAGMTIIHQLWHQCRAAVEVGRIEPTDTIVPTLHVDYGPDPEIEARINSPEYRNAVDQIQSLADSLGVEILIPIVDGHRRRTYRVDLMAFARFWESSGRELWGDLFDVEPTETLSVALGAQIPALA